MRLHPDADEDEGRKDAFQVAIWATLLMAGAAAGLCAVLEADPLGGTILVGGALWLAVLVWRWAWRFNAGNHDDALHLVLIDRRRACVVSIGPGDDECEVPLADEYKYCLEGTARKSACELVFECGGQQIRLGVPKDRYKELWLAIKAYGLAGELLLSSADLQRIHPGGSTLIRRWRDAVSPGGYRRAWVERPVWTAWSHVLWPLFALSTVFNACAVALNRRVRGAPARSVEVERRLGPARCINLPTAPVPTCPEVGRAISKGLFSLMSVAPALGLVLVVALIIWVSGQLTGRQWISLRPYSEGWTSWLMGLAVYALWAASCARLVRMASWKAFSYSASPAVILVSTLMFAFALRFAVFALDRLNVAVDKGPPVARFRGRVTGVEQWTRKGKGTAYSMTTLTISPTSGLADASPVEADVRHMNLNIGDELCAEVYPGFFGRPWLSRLRECFRP